MSTAIERARRTTRPLAWSGEVVAALENQEKMTSLLGPVASPEMQDVKLLMRHQCSVSSIPGRGALGDVVVERIIVAWRSPRCGVVFEGFKETLLKLHRINLFSCKDNFIPQLPEMIEHKTAV
ncbi:hypothetical protein CDL15_Pgr028545 [Punica granatum]|uniref:Uncharacterized protein n=1 Tax=Punica granatum TaxID=22663 RepID=A0A218VX82_PUNGR|nr:hypothetical protein CDL15_Pgr028545 [Punica granatum]